jgi:enterochelin esterase-like enzyme
MEHLVNLFTNTMGEIIKHKKDTNKNTTRVVITTQEYPVQERADIFCARHGQKVPLLEPGQAPDIQITTIVYGYYPDKKDTL